MSIFSRAFGVNLIASLKSEEKISDLAQKKVIFSSLFSIILRPTVTADRIIEVISK